MKVGELKKILADVDDDLEIVVPYDFGNTDLSKGSNSNHYKEITEARVDHKFVWYAFDTVGGYMDRANNVYSDREKVFHIK